MEDAETRPEVIGTDAEREILYERLCGEVSRIARHALNPGLTVRDDLEVITAMVMTGILRNLRVLSARQLAVLLAQEADRHAGYVIREPPHYSAEESEGTS